MIPIDSIFSPVKRVAYSVDSARVGQRTDYDKLTLDIETDGSRRAAGRAARGRRDPDQVRWRSSPTPIGSRRCAARATASWPATPACGGDGVGAPGAGGMDDILIEELELGVRSYNCLKRAGIQTVGDLLQKSRVRADGDPELRPQVDRGGQGDARGARAGAPRGWLESAAMRHQKQKAQALARLGAPQGAVDEPVPAR